ncbi:MAG TPA: hypothetical protein PKV77_06520 [Bacteroidales bacterium]|nr:hypothetical protein [Bacteroidales bacterium]
MDDITLPQAATSNNVTGALQQLLLSRVKTPEQAQQVQQRRQQSLQDYQTELKAPPMGGYTGTEHSLYNWIGNIPHNTPANALYKGISAGGDWVKNNAQGLQSGRTAAAKVGYEDAKNEDSESLRELASISALSKGLTPRGGAGSFIQFKDDKGNLYIMNKSTGERELIPASGAPMWDKVYRQAFDKLTGEDDPEAHDKAVVFANQTIKQSPLGVATEDTVQKPTAPVAGPGEQTLSLPKGVKPEAEAMITEQFQKSLALAQNPNTRDQGLAQLDALKKLYPVNSSTTKMDYIDPRGRKQQEGYGADEGKGLYKERQLLSELHGKNSQLVSTLNTMSQMYSDPNVPEGKLGPFIQDFRSAMKGLGIEVDKSTPDAQVFDALAKKLALGMKSADGTNLLPGAMSNYEDQLLQSMSPSLQGTREGNIKLMQLMMEVAKSNIRIAEEGTKLAEGNKNMLGPDWYKRKERVMREEMARLKMIASQMGGQQ